MEFSGIECSFTPKLNMQEYVVLCPLLVGDARLESSSGALRSHSSLRVRGS